MNSALSASSNSLRFSDRRNCIFRLLPVRSDQRAPDRPPPIRPLLLSRLRERRREGAQPHLPRLRARRNHRALFPHPSHSSRYKKSRSGDAVQPNLVILAKLESQCSCFRKRSQSPEPISLVPHQRYAVNNIYLLGLMSRVLLSLRSSLRTRKRFFFKGLHPLGQTNSSLVAYAIRVANCPLNQAWTRNPITTSHENLAHQNSQANLT